jgi:2-deoxy-D-gluconate 3-dehydrogenase
VSVQGWDRVLNINLKSQFSYAQAAARSMIPAGHGGAIVNIASIDAFRPTGNLAHYDASKGGAIMLTKSLAKELGPCGIRGNAIALGGVNTPGARTAHGTTAIDPAAMETMMAWMPLGRMGEPDDIATVALFLASDASRYVRGTTIVVDGGFLLMWSNVRTRARSCSPEPRAWPRASSAGPFVQQCADTLPSSD